MTTASPALLDAPPRSNLCPSSTPTEVDYELSPPTVLLLTRSARTLLSIDAQFSQLGLHVLPFRSVQGALEVLGQLSPVLVLVDVLLPPNGGEAALDSLAQFGGVERCLVVPERWYSVRRSESGRYETLSVPASATTDSKLKRLVSIRAEPLAKLPDLAAAEALLASAP